MFPPKGQQSNNLNQPHVSYETIAQMDQDYIVVGAHVDEATQLKIVSGQYIDFSKLLPKDRVMVADDDRYELVVKDGKTFWSPVSSAENVAITNFQKWEQAFRVFSNIYCKAHPSRSGEMIEYNHIINSIAVSYAWDNVYAYDKDFRLHISRHPNRSWAIILQQAWSLRLRDRISKGSETPGHHHHQQHSQSGGKQKGGGGSSSSSFDYCKRFNRGKCNLGKSCRYKHHCTYCNKFGHGVVVCRKLIFDRENKLNKKESREAVVVRQ